MAQRTAVSAGAIILRDIEGTLKIGLAQHQSSPSTKSWVIPKGHVEPGETIEQAALREIHEEAGLSNVQLITYLGSLLRVSTKSNGDVVEKTIHFYLAYALGNDSSTPPDARFTDVGWFLPEEAVKLLPYEAEQVLVKEHLATLFNT